MWIFIQDQILGMKWLNVMIGNLLTILEMRPFQVLCKRQKLI